MKYIVIAPLYLAGLCAIAIVGVTTFVLHITIGQD